MFDHWQASEASSRVHTTLTESTVSNICFRLAEGRVDHHFMTSVLADQDALFHARRPPWVLDAAESLRCEGHDVEVVDQYDGRGVLMLSGVLPLEMLGASTWPSGVAAQIHCTLDDPFRRQDAIDGVVRAINSFEATVEVFDYRGNGHLFTDASLPHE
jgi:hypothetical protein